MIYCVEDDGAARDLMLYTLNSAGFEAEGFENAADFWQALKRKRPDLVMLDIMLPGENGIDILRKLREQTATADIPVIMETAKGAEYDKVIGLDMGADDYLAKPFGMMEMISRIRAVLRRTSPKEKSQILRLGAIEVNLGEHTASVGGARVDLTLKEYELLCLFLQNPGRAFTRNQLIEKIWGTEYLGETRTVDVHIGTLRTKLGGAGELIKTVRGVGYRMEAQP